MFQNSIKYRQIYFVGNSNGKHRRNMSVGNCGMGGNCLATLGKIPTAGFYLESRRYVFKIYKKNNLLIVKKLNKQIKLY
jgi:hypothetical protein